MDLLKAFILKMAEDARDEHIRLTSQQTDIQNFKKLAENNGRLDALTKIMVFIMKNKT